MLKVKESINIGNLKLRNRIVMPPMATAKSSDGKVNEDLINYYSLRARETGLIILEHEYVSLEGKASAAQLSMADDSVIEGYKTLTDAVHEKGAKIFAQINHAGVAAKDNGLSPLSPSGINVWKQDVCYDVLSLEGIKTVIEDFANAARRVKEAGFDGVEIHAAHGYLLNQFYSPLTNKRVDEYNGNTMEGRTRLHVEVIKAVRAAVGADFPVAMRFGALDYLEGGSKIEEVAEASKIFENAGIDLLDITGGLSGYIIKGNTKPGWFSELSIPAKSAVNIPVILTGGITNVDEAESLLKDGAADLIGVGRALLQDPDWSVKALA